MLLKQTFQGYILNPGNSLKSCTVWLKSISERDVVELGSDSWTTHNHTEKVVKLSVPSWTTSYSLLIPDWVVSGLPLKDVTSESTVFNPMFIGPAALIHLFLLKFKLQIIIFRVLQIVNKVSSFVGPPVLYLTWLLT